MTEKALTFRAANENDLVAIVRMLADDALGAKRERFVSPLPESYCEAFTAIDSDPNNELIVACLGEAVVGVLQLTFIPYLTYQGSWRALIEGVRVDARHRSLGIGQKLFEWAIARAFEWAIARAKERGCNMVQLTTDRAREDALRFYERLGFVASHHGMKLHFGN